MLRGIETPRCLVKKDAYSNYLYEERVLFLMREGVVTPDYLKASCSFF